MADIELVIKMPEEDYKKIIEYGECDYLRIINSIENGIPLPKGHGVLKDVTNLMRGLYTDMQTIEETFTSSDIYKIIDEECPTIIKTDKEIADEIDN